MIYFDIDRAWADWMGIEKEIVSKALTAPIAIKSPTPPLRADLTEKINKRNYPEKRGLRNISRNLKSYDYSTPNSIF